MHLSSTTDRSAQAQFDHASEPAQNLLQQSRETGAVPADATIAKAEPVSKPWVHFVAGGVGGMTAAFVTSPLDVLKTRLQSDFYQQQLQSLRAAHAPTLKPSSPFLSIPRSALLHVRETLQIMNSIYAHEGPRALFKGLGPNLTGVVPASAIKFYVYGNTKRILNEHFYPHLTLDESPVSVHLSAAAIAGVATGTATNPIWLVKTRLQLDKSNASHIPGRGRQYKNSWDCIKQTVRHEGIAGLYRGLSASYLGVTESTLQWVLYEQMKKILARREHIRQSQPGYKNSFIEDTEVVGGRLLAAGAAKLCAALVTYPHEVVRTRMRQAPTVSGEGGKAVMKYTGLVQCFKLVWKEEGMVGLYGGMTPHLLRVVPNAAIMFGMYELILKLAGASS